jgi:hypothetical protein
LVEDPYPNVEKMLTNLEKEKLGTPITAEYQASVRRIHGLVDTSISVYKDRLVGKLKGIDVEMRVASSVPKDKVKGDCSKWDTNNLLLVIEASTEWGPEYWPNPTPFRGENIVGLFAGRA